MRTRQRIVCCVVLLPVLAATPVAGRTDLAFSTFVGGLGTDFAAGVAVDRVGDVYLAGQTTSTAFPVANAAQPANAGGTDAFVAKLSADGSRVLWATYLGGSSEDLATAIAVDADGNAYVTGRTTSLDFPTTPGVYDTTNGRFTVCAGADCIDAFVAKFSADGALVYSTYLGGEHDDYANAIAVDSGGRAVVVGTTNSFGIPRVNAFDPDKRPGTEGFVTKMNATGTDVVFSSYIGGDKGDAVFAVGVDAADATVLAGDTLSENFLVKNALQPANAGGGDPDGVVDAFVAKVDAAGALVFSTYLGGRGRDMARAVAVDASGDVYVAGETSSANFPTASPAQPSLAGATDAFAAKIRGDGAAIVYATYLGGSRDDDAAAIAVGSDGRAAIVGSTRSADFPTAAPVQASCGGCVAPGFFADAVVAVLSADGASVEFATYLGGTAEDEGLAAAAAPDGAFVAAGRTFSSDFPTTLGAFQRSCACAPGNTLNAFVARFGAPPSQVDPPVITGVTALKRPFRLQIAGEHFEQGAQVFIGPDLVAWPTVQVTSATSISVGGGKSLKARFPKGVAVAIHVVNPDGGEATSEFTR